MGVILGTVLDVRIHTGQNRHTLSTMDAKGVGVAIVESNGGVVAVV